MNRRLFLLLLLLTGSLATTSLAQPADVLQLLLRESPESLAKAAMNHGDPQRGAHTFFQPRLACATCHSTGDTVSSVPATIGPDLARPNPALSDEGIVDAILRPSQTIVAGFETTQILDNAGRVTTGLRLSASDDPIQLRDASTGKTLDIPRNDIESLRQNPLSIMPEGVVDQLTSRQQFLDLVRYLMAIRDGGASLASELRPKVVIGSEPLPEYESHIDHAGLISQLDDHSFSRGEAIYGLACASCHGTLEEVGSLPTSLRFAEGKFKNGFDPFAMYQTLTHGYGLMTPQRTLVPEQKYDVIHYIRQSFLRPHNPDQYAIVDQAYLDSLPLGDSQGPAPSLPRPWQDMDYGPNLMSTYEVGDDGRNIAYKGQAIRLDSGRGGVAQGQVFILYEHDTMRAAATWSGPGFIDWQGINFNGAHQRHPRIVGDVLFANRSGPGWANPQTNSFTEVRQAGRDGRFYGPLPKEWIDYQGTYVNGAETILHYRVGNANIHEWPALSEISAAEDTAAPQASLSAADAASQIRAGGASHVVAVERNLLIGPTSQSLTMRIADRPDCTHQSLNNFTAEITTGTTAGTQPETIVDSLRFDGIWSHSNGDLPSVMFLAVGQIDGLDWQSIDGEIRLSIEASDQPRRLTLTAYLAADQSQAQHTAQRYIESLPMLARQLEPLSATATSQRWPESITAPIFSGHESATLAVDTINHPANNLWNCRMRLTGVDFYPDGDSAAVCDWDGNVWRVSQLHSAEARWQRIASGLFQPLGIKLRDGEIFVCCRDQICRLHDLNQDGEIDYYESFNHDHIITEHFHEFAMGLQCDAEGNFYYAKSARHALPAVVPHHGTLLKVSADGAHTTILADGFRAANGVCLNADGTFFVTDQEGHWNPKNRINWVKPGEFYGNMLGYHAVTDVSDAAMTQPLCWITNSFDRSPAELLWVTSPAWGPLTGSLLNMSYGYGKLYVVPHQRIGEQMQGGMCELPIPQFPTGIMRGRFHPDDGGLYLVGMFSWGGNQQDDGGFFRVRYTGQPLFVPLSIECHKTTLRIGLSDPIDPSSVKPKSFAISRWQLKRSADYGSEHYDTEELEVTSARWDAEQQALVLDIPQLAPTWCMEIQFDLRSPDGQPLRRTIHNTIHSTGSVTPAD